MIQHPELADIWQDLEEIEPAKVIPIEQPAELTLPLLPFQKHGVGWMLQQEKLDTVPIFEIYFMYYRNLMQNLFFCYEV